MAKKKTKQQKVLRPAGRPLFKPPDQEADEKALVDHYKQVLTDDTDEQGIGPKDIEKISKLTTVLKDLKRRKK
jgi:hypothetical protein